MNGTPTRRVLSMWQPWATFAGSIIHATGHAPKEWETRHFPVRFGLPVEIVIHATKKFEKELVKQWPFNEVWQALEYAPFPLGALIATATIVECRPAADLEHEWANLTEPAEFRRRMVERSLGNYDLGRFAWRFGGVRALPRPIHLKGRQDILWPLDEATDNEITAQLLEVAQ